MSFTKKEKEMIDEVILKIALDDPQHLMSYWQGFQKEIPSWQIIPRFLTWLTERRFFWKARRVVVRDLYPKLGFDPELKAICPPFLKERLMDSEGLNEVFGQKRGWLAREKERLIQEIQKTEQAQRQRKLEIWETIREIREYQGITLKQEKAAKELQRVNKSLVALEKIKPLVEEELIPLSLVGEPEKAEVKGEAPS